MSVIMIPTKWAVAEWTGLEQNGIASNSTMEEMIVLAGEKTHADGTADTVRMAK